MQRAEELIDLLRLGAFRDKFLSELSTGSRRIVEIAVILAHEPAVVILDEPSSGIAQRETEALGPLLRQVRDYLNCSMLVIEHDMPLITRLADRIVALDVGRVIVEGTASDVINHPLVIESYLGTAGYSDLMSGDGGKARRKPRRKTRRPVASP
jgi:branched-chain amino acid transport system ATP-binding protein